MTYRSSSGRGSAKCRSSIGQVSAKYRGTNMAILSLECNQRIHWINQWIVIYPVDSVIHPLNNRGQIFIGKRVRSYIYKNEIYSYIFFVSKIDDFSSFNTRGHSMLICNLFFLLLHILREVINVWRFKRVTKKRLINCKTIVFFNLLIEKMLYFIFKLQRMILSRLIAH